MCTFALTNDVICLNVMRERQIRHSQMYHLYRMVGYKVKNLNIVLLNKSNYEKVNDGVGLCRPWYCCC